MKNHEDGNCVCVCVEAEAEVKVGVKAEAPDLGKRKAEADEADESDESEESEELEEGWERGWYGPVRCEWNQI